MDAVIAWILAFMVLNAPPGRKTFYPEAQETQIEAEARYRSIATDVAEVVYGPETKPLFGGEDGRSRTAAVVLSIMLYESGFMKNVDTGVGKFARGDNGRSWCLMQMNVGKGRTTTWNVKEDRLPRFGDKPEDLVEGFTGPEMVEDRKKCVIAALRLLRVSFWACPGLPLDQKLRVYGSGNCGTAAADASALRMRTAFKFYDTSKPKRTWVDKDIVALIGAKKESVKDPFGIASEPPSGDEGDKAKIIVPRFSTVN